MPAPPPVTTASLPSSVISSTPRSWNRDHAAADVARLEPLVRRGHVLERHALDLDLNHPGAGEPDDLGELRARAPVREDDGRLERDHAEAEGQRPAADAEHGEVAARQDG